MAVTPRTSMLSSNAIKVVGILLSASLFVLPSHTAASSDGGWIAGRYDGPPRCLYLLHMLWIGFFSKTNLTNLGLPDDLLPFVKGHLV